jgi:hypothetical protein
MELPIRPLADRFTVPGRYRELETRIRRRVETSDTPILFIYAFDPRTSLGPFVLVDRTLIPGAPRAVGSALYAAGFRNVRLVLQQWNPNILPSEARFGGKPPESVTRLPSPRFPMLAPCRAQPKPVRGGI